MSMISIFRFVSLLLRIIISLLFGYSTSLLYSILPVWDFHKVTSGIYVYCLWLLLGIGCIAGDIFFQRTRSAFFAGLIAVLIYALHLIFIPWLLIGMYLHPGKHFGINGGLLLVGLYALLAWPLLAGLIFSGRDREKRYIAILTGIALWTGIYLQARGFRWEISGVYLISGYLVGTIVAACAGLWGWHLRISLERYFVERREERQWRKTITQRWDAS